MKIKILGSGCKNCLTLADNTKTALAELGVEAEIEKVTDFAEIAKYGVMLTPGLVIDEKVVAYGKVLEPQDIEKIIEDLANGEIDIQCANEAVEAEARRKVESSKGSKFGLTLDGQRRQILIQIHTALREKADEYIIKSPSKAIKGLIELGGVDSIQAVTIVTQNFIERKEYGRALAICEMSFKSPSDEEMRQVQLLKRQIKAARLGDLARRMLSSEKSLEEREAEYETLKTAMKMEGINASQILIGKTNSGNIPIYLNKILVDEKQR